MFMLHTMNWAKRNGPQVKHVHSQKWWRGGVQWIAGLTCRYLNCWWWFHCNGENWYLMKVLSLLIWLKDQDFAPDQHCCSLLPSKWRHIYPGSKLGTWGDWLRHKPVVPIKNEDQWVYCWVFTCWFETEERISRHSIVCTKSGIEFILELSVVISYLSVWTPT